MEALFIFVPEWKKPVEYGFERLRDEDSKSHEFRRPVGLLPPRGGVT
jgi:hypothetical protein